MEITGRTVLVSGSARRLGRATALALGRRGARIAVHYRASYQAALETVQELRRLSVDAESFQADLRDPGECERLIAAVLARFGSLHVLVNNAAVFARAELRESTPELWNEHMDVNARAPFFLARAASFPMLEQEQGKIVNLGDSAGEIVWTAYLPYSVSKAALLAVTRGLARSLAPAIQVNAVAPGPVLFPDDGIGEETGLAIDRTLLKRPARPEEVVQAVVFLIKNDYITGELIHVDGGRHVF